MKYTFTVLPFLLVLVLSGCSGKQTETDNKMDYEETKKMVVDILKTDDGKKAIQDVLSSDKVKNEMVMDQKTVKEAIEQNLTSDKAKKFWEKMFKDPKFVSSYAKGLETEHKKVLKDLMKDPDYQKLLMQMWKDPEMEKELLSLLKSSKMRDEVKKVLLETMDSPLVKAKLETLLIKAAEELPAESKKKAGDGSSQDNSSASKGSSQKESSGE
ncbi:spore germination lipoprotein GerD [Bacillus sp. 1P06AnD]|uniref:spore germination lipoprotein GerD n=1 Tax=Bacillus sp. 1P06AnD TaxID=3132208 RepID=UPI0039A2F76C